jgi:hypothetical protein
MKDLHYMEVELLVPSETSFHTGHEGILCLGVKSLLVSLVRKYRLVVVSPQLLCATNKL